MSPEQIERLELWWREATRANHWRQVADWCYGAAKFERRVAQADALGFLSLIAATRGVMALNEDSRHG